MHIISFIGVLIPAFILGIFGFCQIIGSFQNINERPGLWGTILLWIAILGAGALFVVKYIPGQKFAMIIGYAASFITALGQGKIE